MPNRATRTPGGQTTQRAKGRTWPRHASAAAITLLVNAALVLFLSSWRLRRRSAQRPPIRAVPIELADLSPREMQIAPPEPDASLAPAEPPRPRPALPAPPVPPLPPASVRLEPAPEPGIDAIGVPEVSTELPDFIAAPPAPAAGVRPSAPARPQAPRPAAATRGPVLLQPPDLSEYYPRRARRRGITGRTTVRLTVSADGRVIDAAVLRSTPPGVFETAAGRVARTLRFRPALRAGRPVASVISVNMIWRLEE